MIVLMLTAVALVSGLCLLAYTLAVYARPFMIGVEAARWAYVSGSGLIGAGVVGLVADPAAYGLLIALFMVVRTPILRLAVAQALVLIPGRAPAPAPRTRPLWCASCATPPWPAPARSSPPSPPL